MKISLLSIVSATILLDQSTLAFPSSIQRRSTRRISRIYETSSLPSSGAALSESSENNQTKRRVSILVCPAQFCVPDDYQVLFQNLKDQSDGLNIELGSTVVAPLPRTEWIKVARQLPTRNFWDATLPVHKTLGWYFDAMEDALSEILAMEGPDAEVCIIGHSIGGWVARAFLGGLSR